jgi:hypothetical protein
MLEKGTIPKCTKFQMPTKLQPPGVDYLPVTINKYILLIAERLDNCTPNSNGS